MLDEHLGLAEALVRCESCDAGYLLELIAWPTGNQQHREFRVLGVEQGPVDMFLRDLDRDFCDLGRHRAELLALRNQAQLLPLTLLIDVDSMQLLQVDANAAVGSISTRSWRESALQRHF